MEKYHQYTEQEVVAQTSNVIMLFYSRQIEPIAQILDKNFVWIGAYEFQYLRGKDEFLKSIESETNELPCHVSDEEFFVLAHDRSLWTVYGRFTVTAMREDGTMLIAKVRNTFVWRQKNDDFILLHIHGSHARDVPLECDSEISLSSYRSREWFDYIQDVDKTVGPPKKLVFRDSFGTYHFLLPSEILYAMADEKLCTIFTGEGSFSSRISLKEFAEKSPLFVHIHRSYVVNINLIKSIKRYQLELTTGKLLPIGKERYLNIKQSLSEFSK
ncbi:LytTR family transcriptional regulator DNA-binding domain-containing protein [Lachnospiraceae bacterium NSJ-143]|nr:LytTR family transcriptional regulator DNA-binding domain-containing protein [Lachnospiraceae bacterium NSJ-143]